MTYRIVVGVDGSEHGNAALRWALEEALAHEAEIVAVFAWQMPFIGIPGAFDRDEMEIDELALRILALRQPVAHDLRLLATSLKLVTDLERIGDEGVNIAERAEESLDDRGVPRPNLASMAELVEQTLERLECLVILGVGLGQRLFERGLRRGIRV